MKKNSADVDPQAMIQALLETNARMQLTIDHLTAAMWRFPGRHQGNGALRAKPSVTGCFSEYRRRCEH